MDRARGDRVDPNGGVARQRPEASLARCQGARCATYTAGQIGIPAGNDATIAGVASSEGSGSGAEATTGASRIGCSASFASITLIVNPAAIATPAASAT